LAVLNDALILSTIHDAAYFFSVHIGDLNDSLVDISVNARIIMCCYTTSETQCFLDKTVIPNNNGKKSKKAHVAV
jgi:hypothetical protein